MLAGIENWTGLYHETFISKFFESRKTTLPNWISVSKSKSFVIWILSLFWFDPTTKFAFLKFSDKKFANWFVNFWLNSSDEDILFWRIKVLTLFKKSSLSLIICVSELGKLLDKASPVGIAITAAPTVDNPEIKKIFLPFLVVLNNFFVFLLIKLPL